MDIDVLRAKFRSKLFNCLTKTVCLSQTGGRPNPAQRELYFVGPNSFVGKENILWFTDYSLDLTGKYSIENGRFTIFTTGY